MGRAIERPSISFPFYFEVVVVGLTTGKEVVPQLYSGFDWFTSYKSVHRSSVQNTSKQVPLTEHNQIKLEVLHRSCQYR